MSSRAIEARDGGWYGYGLETIERDGRTYVGHGGSIGQRHRGEAVGQRQWALLEVVGRADEIDLIEWRPVRLDREDRLDLIGPRICHRPAERPGL